MSEWPKEGRRSVPATVQLPQYLQKRIAKHHCMPRNAEALQEQSRDCYLVLTSCYILRATSPENGCDVDATSSRDLTPPQKLSHTCEVSWQACLTVWTRCGLLWQLPP